MRPNKVETVAVKRLNIFGKRLHFLLVFQELTTIRCFVLGPVCPVMANSQPFQQPLIINTTMSPAEINYHANARSKLKKFVVFKINT